MPGTFSCAGGNGKRLFQRANAESGMDRVSLTILPRLPRRQLQQISCQRSRKNALFHSNFITFLV